MPDQVLNSLIDAALSPSAPDGDLFAALAALADRLTEVAPADRLAAVRQLVLGYRESERRLASAREAMGHSIGGHSGRQRLRNQISWGADEERLGSVRVREMRTGHLRETTAREACRTLEDGHWYALCFTQEVHADPPAFMLGGSRVTVYRTADIVPLDGGRVLTGEGDTPSS